MEGSEFGSLLQYCQASIENDMKRALGLPQDGDIEIRKRNKHLRKGDFVVVVRKWKTKPPANVDSSSRVSKQCDMVCPTGTSNNTQEQAAESTGFCNRADLVSTLSSLSFKFLHPFHASINEVTADLNITLNLARKQIYETAICEVLNTGKVYGHVAKPSLAATKECICINIDCLFDNASLPFTVNHLRSMLLGEHISALYRANGNSADYVQYPLEDKWRKVMMNYDIPYEKYEVRCNKIYKEEIETLSKEIHHVLHKSEYMENAANDKEAQAYANQGGKVKVASEEENRTVINLKRFLVESGFGHQCTRASYLADFSEQTSELQKLAILEHHIRSSKQIFDPIIHIVPQQKSSHMQTIDIGMRLLGYLNKTSVKQVHYVHGSVLCKNSSSVFTAEDLLRIRTEEVRKAFIIKYGDRVEGTYWEHTVHILSVASIKFELLTNSYRQTVKLDLTDESKANINRHSGVFVMYNCARLSKLLSAFEDSVSRGVYKPLPDISVLDFSLLREEEEWELMFNFVLVYPLLVSECCKSLNGEKAEMYTHKVCRFLQDLSRVLSSYYSRFHILGEPRDHLLPLMYCRLYLLKSIHQVMQNALSLLSIEPLMEM